MASGCPTLVLSILFTYQTIYASIINCEGSDFCRQNILNCNASEDCNITCKGDSSCRDTQIICPPNANCTIDCLTYQNTCRNTTIKAINSTYLILNCPLTTDYYNDACDDASIYCPDNGHSGLITCVINGVDDRNIQRQLDVYAVEGFNDAIIYGNKLNNAIMHCTSDYQTSCDINKQYPFQCASCSNILSPTKFPTNTPSFSPSFNPTIEPTNEPTIEPTLTTISPTITPSYNTYNPTIVPTFNTYSPTLYQIVIPTISPTPSPVLEIIISEPTIAPTKHETSVEDVETTVTDKDNNNTHSSENKLLFELNASNIIILILCVIILLLLCIICMYLIKKCRKKWIVNKSCESESVIIIEMKNKNNSNNNKERNHRIIPSESNLNSISMNIKKKSSLITTAALEVLHDSESDIDDSNIVSSYLMAVNTHEGGELNEENNMYIEEITPNDPQLHEQNLKKQNILRKLNKHNSTSEYENVDVNIGTINSDANSYIQASESFDSDNNNELLKVTDIGNMDDSYDDDSSSTQNDGNVNTTTNIHIAQSDSEHINGNESENENEHNDSNDNVGMSLELTDIGDLVAAIDHK